MATPIYRRLKEVAEDIRDADLLLFRRRSAISVAGRGDHSHAALAGWWDSTLCCLEVREWHGGRIVTLASQVKRFSGRIDVFRSGADSYWQGSHRADVVRFMRNYAGCDYGWTNVILTGLTHLAVARIFVRAETDDTANGRRPPFCSEAVVRSFRVGGGVDPVPNLADRMTEPADLARSPFFAYHCTLV